MSVALIQPVTSAIALRVGTLDAQLAIAGERVDFPDLIIGCTALELGFRVATRNRAHFERIPGLKIVTLIQQPKVS